MPPTTAAPLPVFAPDARPVLAVDLDGTLIRSDLLHESLLQYLHHQPWSSWRTALWLVQGKAVLKQQLAQRAEIDPAGLPYHTDFLAWLQTQHQSGRRLLLCTAADQRLAQVVAAHCGVFEAVLASDGQTNLDGPRKAQALVQRFGLGGFDYAGNADSDVVVWQAARQAIVVNASARLLAQAQAQTGVQVERVFASTPGTLRHWPHMLRLHQWLKNLLLFVPLLAAHQLPPGSAWGSLWLAFVAFSLCASSVYICNDLLDLESDRKHPRKRQRPFAAGALPVWLGLLLAPLLALASLLLALTVGPAFAAWLALYLALTLAYSWWLKRLVLLDCLALALLYTLRVVAGAAAAGLALSFWLLAFSGFLFLSLAFVKRYAELHQQRSDGKPSAPGRGYLTSDAPLVQTLGVSAGYTAVVVLALYVHSDAVLPLYSNPALLWAAVPIMAYWVSWVWLCAFRGTMHDDPLLFAFQDRSSWVAGLLFGAVLLLANLGLPW